MQGEAEAMSALETTRAALLVAAGLAAGLFGLAWFTMFPTIGVLWLFGALT